LKVLRRFRDWLRLHLQGATDGLVKQVIPWFYQAISSTLKMEAESIPETFENFHTFTWLCARKDFTVWVFYAFFWVTSWRPNLICRRFGTLCSIFIGG
jgi:hypothetical protein